MSTSMVEVARIVLAAQAIMTGGGNDETVQDLAEPLTPNAQIEFETRHGRVSASDWLSLQQDEGLCRLQVSTRFDDSTLQDDASNPRRFQSLMRPRWGITVQAETEIRHWALNKSYERPLIAQLWYDAGLQAWWRPPEGLDTGYWRYRFSPAMVPSASSSSDDLEGATAELRGALEGIISYNARGGVGYDRWNEQIFEPALAQLDPSEPVVSRIDNVALSPGALPLMNAAFVARTAFGGMGSYNDSVPDRGAASDLLIAIARAQAAALNHSLPGSC